MSSREFAEWLAYERLEPFGPERADARAALVAQTVANYAGRTAKRWLTLRDFLLPLGRSEEELVEERAAETAGRIRGFMSQFRRGSR